ncbi:MAG: tRNA (guanosine(46)-N7)-methyltransferase TrmB [Saprospiraceae bacterium]|nr:tRNA (guanosine(46)-N7)-methyltransferase TrmB [Saprospiraceae bacterium]
MPKKNKLQKFEEILHFPNVLESYDKQSDRLHLNDEKTVTLRGKWSSQHFNNDHPIVLELACGKGEYTLGLARLYPDLNFIGVDIKGNRIWKGAKQALQEGLENVAFLRTRIENIELHFGPSEVDEIWITFPDPFPRKSRSRRRLTAERFLDIYRNFLNPGGLVKLKTDAQSLFEWSLETWEAYPHCTVLDVRRDLYAHTPEDPRLMLRTFYEEQHLAEGKIIYYLEGRLD